MPLIAVLLLVPGRPARAREISLSERIEARERLERVYWSYRIWPGAAAARPAFEQTMPKQVIRDLVEDELRRSDALQQRWGYRVTPGELQAEIDRMSRRTKDSRMLRALWFALGNDPLLVAESLARPTLMNRRIRAEYARDRELHAEPRRLVDAWLERPTSAESLRQLGADYREVLWELSSDAGPLDDSTAYTEDEQGRKELSIGREEWVLVRAALSRRRGGGGPGGIDFSLDSHAAADEKPGAIRREIKDVLLSLDRILELDDSFTGARLLEEDAEHLRLAIVRAPKVPFDSWWQRSRTSFSVAAGVSDGEYVLPAILDSSCTDDTWVATRVEALTPRRDHSAVWTGAEMIIWGGQSDRPFVYNARYSPATDSWEDLEPAPPAPWPRYEHKAFWTGSEMIVWGGKVGSTSVNTGARYDPITQVWSPMSVTGAPPHSKGQAVWTGSEMFFWGEGSVGGYHYDPSDDRWKVMPQNPFLSARRAFSMLWTGGEILFWGGTASTDLCYRFNPTTNLWTQMSSVNAPGRRSYHSTIWTGSEMIVWGGMRTAVGTEVNTGGRYNPSTDTWQATSLLPGVPAVRTGHVAVWTGSEMIVWGGGVGSTPYSTGGRYRPATNTWLPTSVGAGVPTPRFGMTGVWTGNQFIVWGGQDGDYAFLDNGGRYAPGTDSWSPTYRPPDKAPSPRSAHSAVWTGAEMIVWGGGDVSGVYRSGGSYIPAKDDWEPTPLVGAPDARKGHTALWTGTEMIVWGGTVGTAVLGSGGRYNPATESWTAIGQGGNPPAARERHTAIWTGGEMIVWGGSGSGGAYLNSGGRFDPSSNTWVPTSLGTNAPGVRSFHTAVWSGSEMIVWGGSNGSGTNLNTGGRYRPLNDTWRPTSTGAGVPTGRYGQSGIWTGSEMIIWGGGATSLSNDGARYDPVADHWVATSVGSNVPTPRHSHRTVWTGDEMIVWGGYGSNGQQYVSGGRYRPAIDSWLPTSLTHGDFTTTVETTESSAVWTGREMIVWGGRRFNTADHVSIGARYCATACPLSTWYLDADADSRGDSAHTQLACSQPGGYVGAGGDCDDSSATVWLPPPELTDLIVEKDLPAAGDMRFAWLSQDAACGPATDYQVARGRLASLRASGFPAEAACAGTTGDTPLLSDLSTCSQPTGDGCWFLARGRNICASGTYGPAAVDTAAPCP